MTEITGVSLVHEVRSFGWRVFDLADQIGADEALASRIRKTAAAASRHLARRGQAIEPRIEGREACQAFKALGDVVTLLDELAATQGSVEASTLAVEATGLTERIYELCALA